MSCTTANFVADVRYGSKADMALLNFDVRFTPESGHSIAAIRNVRFGPTTDMANDVRLTKSVGPNHGCPLWVMSRPEAPFDLYDSGELHALAGVASAFHSHGGTIDGTEKGIRFPAGATEPVR